MRHLTRARLALRRWADTAAWFAFAAPVMALGQALIRRAERTPPTPPGGPGCEARLVCRYPHCDCPPNGPCDPAGER